MFVVFVAILPSNSASAAVARATSFSIAVLFAAMFVVFVAILPSNSASAAVARATSFSIAVLFAAIFVAFVAISDVFWDTALSIILIAPVNVVSLPAIVPVKASATAFEFADSSPNVLSTHCCFSANIASASDIFTFLSNSVRIAPFSANAPSMASFAPFVIVSKIGLS